MELGSLLAEMIERKASDLHLVAGVPPVFRVDGELVYPTPPNLTQNDVNALLASALPEEKLAAARHGQPFSATLRQDTRTFRCQVFRDREELAAAVRIAPERIPTLAEMHLPPVFETLTSCPRGLVLLAGPSGSGKTTTLVSMLEHINQTHTSRIYTLEAPLNYVISSKLSLVTQQVIGEDVDSYERGLTALRNADPDVVFVGELRTPEVAWLAMELAEAGSLIFSQMNAQTAGDAVNGLLALLGEPQDAARRLLARTVQAVIAQRLLPRNAPTGRVAANEILLLTPRIRQMISDGQTAPNLLELAMSASRPAGMQTMDEALLDLYADAVISRETAEAYLKEKRLPG